MAANFFVDTAARALAQHRKVEILAASRRDWTTLTSIAEPQPGIVHMTIDSDVPMDFYLPADSISGIRVAR